MNRQTAGVALVALLMSGCVTHVAPWKLNASDDPIEQPRIAELCRQLLTNSRSRESARFLYNVSIKSGDEQHNLRLAFVNREPGFSRVEILPLRGALSMGIVVIKQGEGIALIPPDNRAFKGSSERRLLEEIMPGFAFSMRELITVLMGEIPESSCLENKDYRWTFAGNKDVIVTRKDESGAWLLRGGTGVSRYLRRDDLSPASPMYIDIGERNTAGIPESIIVTMPSVDTVVSMRLEQGMINIPVSDRPFEVAIPEGYVVSEVG